MYGRPENILTDKLGKTPEFYYAKNAIDPTISNPVQNDAEESNICPINVPSNSNAPGTWLCDCGNINTISIKSCLHCGQKKPDEESFQNNQTNRLTNKAEIGETSPRNSKQSKLRYFLAYSIVAVVILAAMGIPMLSNDAETNTLDYYKTNSSNVSKIDRESFYRNPGKYDGNKVVIYGNVVSYIPGDTFIMYVDDSPWVVIFEMPEQNRVLQGDLVAFYGTLDGLKVMTRTGDGVEKKVEVPCVQARYVEHR